jgi:hypothetical protein
MFGPYYFDRALVVSIVFRDHSNITKAGLRTFSYPPTLYVLIVSKNGHFLNPPIQSNDYVIFEWSLTYFQYKNEKSFQIVEYEFKMV